MCVHAFPDDQGIFQYLPWNHRGWHAGGSANNTHIGFEICEPASFKYGGGANMVGYDAAKHEAYLRAIWKNAVELCVMLCKLYGLSEGDIICHSEGYLSDDTIDPATLWSEKSLSDEDAMALAKEALLKYRDNFTEETASRFSIQARHSDEEKQEPLVSFYASIYSLLSSEGGLVTPFRQSNRLREGKAVENSGGVPLAFGYAFYLKIRLYLPYLLLKVQKHLKAAAFKFHVL